MAERRNKTFRVGACFAAALILTAVCISANSATQTESKSTPEESPKAPKATEATTDKPAKVKNNPATKPAEDPYKMLVEKGWHQLSYSNYPGALESLNKVLAESTSRENKADAIMALAYLWHYKNPGADVDKAKEYYHWLLKEFKDTKPAPYAAMTLVHLIDLPRLESDRKIEEARRRYEDILKSWPNHLAADDAALRLGLTYIQQVGDKKEEDKGAKIIREHLKRRSDNVLAAAMYLALGKLSLRRGDHEQAIEDWINSAKAGIPGTDQRSKLYYQIAHTFECKLKDYEKAAIWYDKIVYEIKRVREYHVAKLAAKRCRKLAGIEEPEEPEEENPEKLPAVDQKGGE